MSKNKTVFDTVFDTDAAETAAVVAASLYYYSIRYFLHVVVVNLLPSIHISSEE